MSDADDGGSLKSLIPAAISPSVSELVDAVTLAGEVAVKQLTPQEREVVDYIVANRCSVGECAEALDIDRSNVYRSLRRSHVKQELASLLVCELDSLESMAVDRVGRLLRDASLSDSLKFLEHLERRRNVSSATGSGGELVLFQLVVPSSQQ